MGFFARRLCLVFFICVIATSGFEAQASLFEGIGLEIDDNFYATRHFWNKDGKRRPAHNTFKINQIELWASYELTDRDFCVFHANYDFIDESLHGSSVGFGDVEASWTREIAHGDRGNFYAELLTVIPAGREKHSIRYGVFGLEGSLRYAWPFRLFCRDGSACARLGYRAYCGFPSDQVRADLGFLWNVHSWLYLRGCANLEYGVFNGKREEHYNIILYNPNYRLFKIQMELMASVLPCTYLNIGFFSHLWGENVGTGGGFTGGLTVSF